MREQGGGCIINTASTAGLRPRPGLTWYNASKGAAITMTKSMAAELGPDNIRVNALCPVAGDTPLLPSFLGANAREASRRRCRSAGSAPPRTSRRPPCGWRATRRTSSPASPSRSTADGACSGRGFRPLPGIPSNFVGEGFKRGFSGMVDAGRASAGKQTDRSYPQAFFLHFAAREAPEPRRKRWKTRFGRAAKNNPDRKFSSLPAERGAPLNTGGGIAGQHGPGGSGGSNRTGSGRQAPPAQRAAHRMAHWMADRMADRRRRPENGKVPACFFVRFLWGRRLAAAGALWALTGPI